MTHATQRTARADAEAAAANEPAKLSITLVSDESYRLCCLHNELRTTGLKANLRLKKPGHATASRLRRLDPEKAGPELIIIDFTVDQLMSRRMLKSIAFGENRSRMALAVLTRPATEMVLDSGEVDGGEATMFSPTSIDTLFAKLAGPDSDAMLRSISVLNQYGPVLIRANDECEACDTAQQSA